MCYLPGLRRLIRYTSTLKECFGWLLLASTNTYCMEIQLLRGGKSAVMMSYGPFSKLVQKKISYVFVVGLSCGGCNYYICAMIGLLHHRQK